jgi:hypothetical protein
MMKTGIFTFFFLLLITAAQAQQQVADSAVLGTVIITKDSRIDVFGQKMADYNQYISKMIRASKGYRLMLLNTNNRAEAMQVRSKLLQQFPDQKVYMTYQTPYIKLKFGNFSDKDEADRFRKQILSQRIVNGNIYILAETIEVKPDKLNASNN